MKLFGRLTIVIFVFTALLFCSAYIGLSFGSSGGSLTQVWNSVTGGDVGSVVHSIIWKIRFPRMMMGCIAGATLALGGLVFQAILKNPLSEPYILGVSGGAAVGAMAGLTFGLSQFPGLGLMAFSGSMVTMLLVFYISSGKMILKKDAMLLSGVMVNVLCSALIILLISMTRDSRIHSIIFWLMGDLSSADNNLVIMLLSVNIPCFLVVFFYSHKMNILMTGRETAVSMGVNVRGVTLLLLAITSIMVSFLVSVTGLLGFVGLVVPHILRLFLGNDHRIIVPACILGGGSYMILCDLLARTLPPEGEMPTGVITALIGAPLFIILLKRSFK